MKKLLILALAVGVLNSITCRHDAEKQEWISLFNGVDLDGWTMKFSGCELNENYLNTFRVEDSLLKISYDEYELFENRYGHLFYHQPFSHYRLRLEYRFTGEKLPDSPWWTENNSGVMIHAQAPKTMPLIADPTDENLDLLGHFPLSIECQLLGEAVTANACQIGAFIDIDGAKAPERNMNSNSKTFPADQWVQLEVAVYGDSIVHHMVQGDTVLTYTNLRRADDGRPLSEGYIALQAESQPVEFRKIEVLKIPH